MEGEDLGGVGGGGGLVEEEVQREGGWDGCSALGLRVSEAFFFFFLSVAAALRGERKRSGVTA